MSDRQALEIKVEAALRREAPVAPGERLLLGVSGGADSVALLHVLAALAPRLKFELRAAHLNHGWRGRDSANDARFVNALCKRLGVPCTIKKMTEDKSKPPPAGGRRAHSGGREARARAARYAFLERVAKQARCHRVAVAHHRDDLAETVLINLLRGSGPLGLSGFAPLARCGELPLIRPLIHATRAEIETYCRDRRLRWREDQTNRDQSFLRNRVRLELLPLIERGYNPRFRDALVRLADILREEENWGEARAARRYRRFRRGPEGAPPQRLPLRFLLDEPPALVRRCVRQWLTELRPGDYPPPLAAVDDLIRFARDVAPGGLLHSTDSLIFRKTRRHIELVSNTPGHRLRRR